VQDGKVQLASGEGLLLTAEDLYANTGNGYPYCAMMFGPSKDVQKLKYANGTTVVKETVTAAHQARCLRLDRAGDIKGPDQQQDIPDQFWRWRLAITKRSLPGQAARSRSYCIVGSLRFKYKVKV